MNIHLAKFMTYFEIHRMHRDGHSISYISRHLVIDRRTASKYLTMSEQEYEDFLVSNQDRKKILQPYEAFVKGRLEAFNDTSAAQMHDWLKEHHPDLPKVSQKTVFNFVAWVREKHRLPVVKAQRQYELVEETPYGKQAQVDFGEYNLRTTSGARVKVFFFAMVLSRSRYKYLWFTDRRFTSELAIQAHELAFEYISGIPDEIVYDQDKVFITNENAGDIILTDAFRAYTRQQSFALYFCRKSDPESKGKVENLVKYVKQNFLYNRTYHNIETLNNEAMAWLRRTANALPHAFTRKEPCSEWIIEQPFLTPYHAHIPKIVPITTYKVNPNNMVSYRGNSYSVPYRTYQGRKTQASLRLEQSFLVIFDEKGQQEICRHELAIGKGKKIINTDHKRDKSAAIREMIEQVAALFPSPEKAMEWMNMIRADKPRYIRDQLMMLKNTVTGATAEQVAQAMEYCLANSITSASDFKSIISFQQEDRDKQTKVVRLNPLNGKAADNANIQPNKSAIEDYQAILNKS